VFFSYFLFLQKESNKEKEPTGGRHFPGRENARIPLLDLPPVLAAPYTKRDWGEILERSIGERRDKFFGFCAKILVFGNCLSNNYFNLKSYRKPLSF